MSEPGISVLVRADVGPFLAGLYGVSGQLRQLERIYSISSSMLGSPAVVEHRMWADLHLEALGWALVGLVASIPFIVLLVR